MQRIENSQSDRGAVAVWVAILLVPFLVLAALAVDIGAAHADRQRLQTGADVAALAIAQQCALGDCNDPLAPEATADQMVTANDTLNTGAQGDVVVGPVDNYVEVTATDSRAMWFDIVAEADSLTQTQVGAAVWGPIGGSASVAWAFHSCELATPITTGPTAHRPAVLELDATGHIVGLSPTAIGTTVQLDQSKHSATECDKPYGGNFEPGSFGWLDGGSDCQIDTSVGQWVEVSNGGSTRGDCEDLLETLVGQRLLVPVFDDSRKVPPTSPEFHIAGYIAVDLISYNFKATGKDYLNVVLREWVATDAEIDPTAPSLGVNTVQAVLPREPTP